MAATAAPTEAAATAAPSATTSASSGAAHEPDVVPAVAPPPPPARPRVLLTGTALALAVIGMFFAGLLGIYLATRHGVVHPLHGKPAPWLPQAAEMVKGKPVPSKIPLTPANTSLFTMLLSVVTMQWAVYAVGNNDRQNAFLALGLTIMFGVAVITATSFLYSQMHLPVSTQAGVLIYTVTGAHLAMLVGALVFASVMTFRTLGGEYAGRDREGISAAALFWYATVGLYAVVWYAVYVTK